MSRKIDLIVIHCSDSPNGRATTAQEIDRWHRERGFMRSGMWREIQEPTLTSIGYHFVIYTTGAVENGRHLDEVGAHVQGYNASSIGICMIGCDAFSRAQWDALRDKLCGMARYLEQQQSHPPAKRLVNPSPSEALAIFTQLGVRVVAHHELNPGKTCPNFSVAYWLERGMQPLASEIYPTGGTPT